MLPQQATPDDAQLVLASARGDEAAFAQLFRLHAPALLGLLTRILRSRADAEDVLQEVFFEAWAKAATFDAERGRVFTWLATRARSRAIDRLRTQASRSRAELEALPGEVSRPSAYAAPDAGLATHALRASVGGALAGLTSKQQEVILLAYFDGLTQSEIASKLDVPLGTVKTHARQGLIKLRASLNGAGDQHVSPSILTAATL